MRSAIADKREAGISGSTSARMRYTSSTYEGRGWLLYADLNTVDGPQPPAQPRLRSTTEPNPVGRPSLDRLEAEVCRPPGRLRLQEAGESQ